MNRSISVRFSLVLWLGLVCILALANRYLFTVPIYEDGDGAANALQIIKAKSFQEIYGNYSRWHFHHPGPFFFYLYAFGEILFHDFLPIFPAPHNAHVLTGIAIQSGFLITTLHIAANYFRSLFFLPLALFGAIVHFGSVAGTLPGSVFTSLWPPHVLLFPFLCFLASCASLATGRVQHLPIAIFCACALVHGHVAQPLFVLPIGLGSYGFFAWRLRQRAIGFRSPLVLLCHGIALLIIAIFSLPLVLDLFKGQDSNFANILDHLSRNRSKKTWLQGFFFVISYFSYFGTQQILILPDAGEILLERWPYFALWTVILGYLVFSWLYRPEEPTIDRRFERSFSIVILAAFLLSIVWGQRQDGQMFNFNGYYIFSIPYAVLLIFIGRFASRLSFTNKQPFRIAFIAAVLAGFGIFIGGFSADSTRIMKQIDVALQSDLAKDLPKLIFVDHENWSRATALALALRRKEVPFYVHSDWDFMFGEENVQARQWTSPTSIWSLRSSTSVADGVPFGDNTSLVMSSLGPDVVIPLTLDFGRALPPEIIIDGFANFNPLLDWVNGIRKTTGDRATIDFSRRLPADFTLILQASAFGEDDRLPVRVTIGDVVREVNLTKTKSAYRLNFEGVRDTSEILLTPLLPESSERSTVADTSRGIKLFTVTVIPAR